MSDQLTRDELQYIADWLSDPAVLLALYKLCKLLFFSPPPQPQPPVTWMGLPLSGGMLVSMMAGGVNVPQMATPQMLSALRTVSPTRRAR